MKTRVSKKVSKVQSTCDMFHFWCPVIGDWFVIGCMGLYLSKFKSGLNEQTYRETYRGTGFETLVLRPVAGPMFHSWCPVVGPAPVMSFFPRQADLVWHQPRRVNRDKVRATNTGAQAYSIVYRETYP